MPRQQFILQRLCCRLILWISSELSNLSGLVTEIIEFRNVVCPTVKFLFAFPDHISRLLCLGCELCERLVEKALLPKAMFAQHFALIGTVNNQRSSFRQNVSFRANCMIRAGAVLLICPATGLPMTAFGTPKFAWLNALNISHRKLNRHRSVNVKFR